MKHIILSIAILIFAVSDSAASCFAVQDSTKSLLVNQLQAQYDFVLGYTEGSYWWQNQQHYKVLARSGEQWYAIEISGRKNKRGKVKTGLRKCNFSTDLATQLMDSLDARNFWNLNPRLLNQTSWPLNDSIAESLHISDGVNNKFKVLSRDSYKVIESYEPDSYLSKFPAMTSRKTFIDCRRLFREAWLRGKPQTFH